MNHKGLKFYLKYGFGFGFFLALLAGIQTDFSKNFNLIIKDLLFATFLFLSIGIIISLIFYWYIEKFIPKYSINVLHKPCLLKFHDLGFKNKGGYLEKENGNEKCRIWWEAVSLTVPSKCSINIFVPCKVSRSKAIELNEKLNDKTLIFYDKGILKTVNYSFRTPKFKTLKENYNSLLRIISENNLEFI